MCYHEQLIFKCGCKARNIVPCPRRLHLERNSTVNWRRLHKLTRVCPRLEYDQLNIDIDCEVCGLLHQDVKPFTNDYAAYAAEHAAMHQRLLGKRPSYIMLTEPAWSYWWDRYYDRRDQVLRRRVINAPGIRLRFVEQKQERQSELDRWRSQAPAVPYGSTNLTSATNAAADQGQAFHGYRQPGLLQQSRAVPPQNRPSMVPHAQPIVPQHPQLPPYVPQQSQPMPATRSDPWFPYKPPCMGGQQRNIGSGWQAPRLEPRLFTAPAVPPYRNPFITTATNTKSWSGRPSVPSFRNPYLANGLANTNDYSKRYANNPPPTTNHGSAPLSYGGFAHHKRGLENQVPAHADQVGAKRRRIEHKQNAGWKKTRNDSGTGFGWNYGPIR